MPDVPASATSDLRALRRWVGREYWPNPEGFVPDPVRAIDIARYTSAVQDKRDWSADPAGNSAPPGFMEVASPNYLHYHRMGGNEFLRHLLPFESPWGPDWTPMMLLRDELWEIERPVVVGDVVRGTSTITDVTWQEARGERPEMLGIEFTKVYRDAADGLLGRVVWDMVFVEHGLVEHRPEVDPTPPPPNDVVRRNGGTPRVDDPVGRYSRQFDMEALVRWGAAIWDLGLPHVDPDYARRVYGLAHAVAHGPFINACLGRMVTDWMDAGDRVVMHRGRFRRPVVGNDRLTFSGVVLEVTTTGPRPAVAIHGHATNQYGDVVAESETRCELGV